MTALGFARLVSYVTNLCRHELDGFQIDDMLKIISSDVLPTPPKVDLKPLFNFLLGENKIEAIKEYRSLTRASLVDSKNEVERIYNQIKREWNQ